MAPKHRSITFSQEGILNVYALDNVPNTSGAQIVLTYNPKLQGAGTGQATAEFAVGLAEAGRIAVSPLAWNPHCPFVGTWYLGQDISSHMPAGFPAVNRRRTCTRKATLIMKPTQISWQETSDAGSMDLTKFVGDAENPDPTYVFTLIEDATATGTITVTLPDGKKRVFDLVKD